MKWCIESVMSFLGFTVANYVRFTTTFTTQEHITSQELFIINKSLKYYIKKYKLFFLAIFCREWTIQEEKRWWWEYASKFVCANICSGLSVAALAIGDTLWRKTLAATVEFQPQLIGAISKREKGTWPLSSFGCTYISDFLERNILMPTVGS